VEVPLLQRLTLLLGHPTVAFAVVVASLLLFSGVGSLLSQRIGWLVGLVGLALSIPLTAAGVSLLEATILGTTLPVRVLASGLCLAPLGLLLGVPFARGLGHLVRTEPNLVPWAWAVNGSASVVASVGVALGALALGFSAVLAVGSAAYVGAAMVAARWRRPSVGR
jgi:hypothetical protein